MMMLYMMHTRMAYNKPDSVVVGFCDVVGTRVDIVVVGAVAGVVTVILAVVLAVAVVTVVVESWASVFGGDDVTFNDKVVTFTCAVVKCGCVVDSGGG